MVQSPEERQNTLRRSLSQSEGDAHKISDGLNPNAEVQQRAMQRYQKLLKGDKQVQVSSRPPNVQLPMLLQVGNNMHLLSSPSFPAWGIERVVNICWNLQHLPLQSLLSCRVKPYKSQLWCNVIYLAGRCMPA